MDAFFGFLKTRIAGACKYGPAARITRCSGRCITLGCVRKDSCAAGDFRCTSAVDPGKLHVRFGKGPYVRDPRPWWVPMLSTAWACCCGWFLPIVQSSPDSPVLLPTSRVGRCIIRTMPQYGVGGSAAAGNSVRTRCAGRVTTHNYEAWRGSGCDSTASGHWTVSSTMRYVRPSATFIEDAYPPAGGCLTTLAESWSGEGGTA